MHNVTMYMRTNDCIGKKNVYNNSSPTYNYCIQARLQFQFSTKLKNKNVVSTQETSFSVPITKHSMRNTTILMQGNKKPCYSKQVVLQMCRNNIQKRKIYTWIWLPSLKKAWFNHQNALKVDWKEELNATDTDSGFTYASSVITDDRGNIIISGNNLDNEEDEAVSTI